MKKENRPKGYFIDRTGQIRGVGFNAIPYDTESFGLENWFPTRLAACEIRDIMQENHPRIFLCLKRKV